MDIYLAIRVFMSFMLIGFLVQKLKATQHQLWFSDYVIIAIMAGIIPEPIWCYYIGKWLQTKIYKDA